MLFLIILIALWWYISAYNAEESPGWKKASDITNILMLVILFFLVLKGRIFLSTAQIFLWWVIVTVKEDEWENRYAFTNSFLIGASVGIMPLGIILGIYTVSNNSLNAISEKPYFSEVAKIALITGLIIGAISGVINLKKRIS
jgi:magnesium-transporting ATPase (P-type)